MTQITLKPCSHCGGEAELGQDTCSNDDYHESEYWVYWVACKVCRIGTMSYETKIEAITVWQNRVEQKCGHDLAKEFLDGPDIDPI